MQGGDRDVGAHCAGLLTCYHDMLQMRQRARCCLQASKSCKRLQYRTEVRKEGLKNLASQCKMQKSPDKTVYCSRCADVLAHLIDADMHQQ